MDSVDLAADFMCWKDGQDWMPSYAKPMTDMFSFCQHPYLLDPQVARRSLAAAIRSASALSLPPPSFPPFQFPFTGRAWAPRLQVSHASQAFPGQPQSHHDDIWRLVAFQAKRKLIQVNTALSMGREVLSSLVGSEAPVCVLKVCIPTPPTRRKQPEAARGRPAG